MITTNARTKDLEDVGLLFHSILRYAEANAERLDRSIISIGYSALLSRSDQAARWLAELHVDTGEEWDGCVWLERLEAISEGSLAQMLYAEEVDVESAVIRWLSPAVLKKNSQPEQTANLFVMNSRGHYFEVNMRDVAVDKGRLRDCQLYESESALMQAVGRQTGCSVNELVGSAFYITMRNGAPTIIDDRGFAQAIEGPVEDFIADFEL